MLLATSEDQRYEREGKKTPQPSHHLAIGSCSRQ